MSRLDGSAGGEAGVLGREGAQAGLQLLHAPVQLRHLPLRQLHRRCHLHKSCHHWRRDTAAAHLGLLNRQHHLCMLGHPCEVDPDRLG